MHDLFKSGVFFNDNTKKLLGDFAEKISQGSPQAEDASLYGFPIYKHPAVPPGEVLAFMPHNQSSHALARRILVDTFDESPSTTTVYEEAGDITFEQIKYVMEGAATKWREDPRVERHHIPLHPDPFAPFMSSEIEKPIMDFGVSMYERMLFEPPIAPYAETPLPLTPFADFQRIKEGMKKYRSFDPTRIVAIYDKWGGTALQLVGGVTLWIHDAKPMILIDQINKVDTRLADRLFRAYRVWVAQIRLTREDARRERRAGHRRIVRRQRKAKQQK